MHTDPLNALERAMDRVMHEQSESHGRTVPIQERVNAHTGANAVIRQTALHYARDPRVKILAQQSGEQDKRRAARRPKK